MHFEDGRLLIFLWHKKNSIDINVTSLIRKDFFYVAARIVNIKKKDNFGDFVDEYENFLKKECEFDENGYIIRIPKMREWDFRDFVEDGVFNKKLLRESLNNLKELVEV